MSLFIADKDHPRWPAADWQIKMHFGLRPTAKWPAEGCPKREIQGITCWVEPMAAPVYRERYGKTIKAKSSKHRTFGICPVCHTIQPLGRMKQHSVVHAR